MTDYEELVKTLRKQCADMDCGNCNTCINCKAADAIEKLSKPKQISMEERKKMTNADKIRHMTDEELDKFLGEVQWDVANCCGGITQKQEYPVPEQIGAWLDWLRQEVESDD